jgi:hemerythrin superfamily protein
MIEEAANVDAIELLTMQHRETEEVVDRFEQASDVDERARLAMLALRQLRAHTTIEEELFYPAVREGIEELRDEVLEDLEEHHAVEMLLDELEAMSAEDERFAAKFQVIAEMVLHHVEEEEQEQFPTVRARLPASELERMGDAMASRYEELMEQMELDSATKQDLYEQAQALDIEGRSQMSKRQLTDAIRAHG